MDTWYLRKRATTIDTEILGIAMGWKAAHKIATDSQRAISRIMQLR